MMNTFFFKRLTKKKFQKDSFEAENTWKTQTKKKEAEINLLFAHFNLLFRMSTGDWRQADLLLRVTWPLHPTITYL